MEEIRSITWDLWGVELSHEQAIQRLVRAGFPVWRINPETNAPESPLLIMFAIVEGESGEYKEAWHINVEREDDGSISRFNQDGSHWSSGPQYMKVDSIDLGFLQNNVKISILLPMEVTAVSVWVQGQFALHPQFAIPEQAAEYSFNIWKARGYHPWYAYKPGTDPWQLKMTYGAKAFGNWLVHSFVDKKKNLEYKS